MALDVVAVVLALAVLVAICTTAYLGVRHAQLADHLSATDAARRDAVRDLGTEQADNQQLRDQLTKLRAASAALEARVKRAEAAAIVGLPDDELADRINHPGGGGAPPPRDPRDELLPFPAASGDPEPATDGAGVPTIDAAAKPAG